MNVKGFTLYRIWYGKEIVYVGRTKQPLQNRIRGHLFAKPMHRSIHIESVTKIEYATFKTEADMNLYEIYFILKWHPPLNVDDKTRDNLTVRLPQVEWNVFETPLWEKWRAELSKKDEGRERDLRRYRDAIEEQRVVRALFRTGEISEDEKYDRLEILAAEIKDLENRLWGR